MAEVRVEYTFSDEFEFKDHNEYIEDCREKARAFDELDNYLKGLLKHGELHEQVYNTYDSLRKKMYMLVEKSDVELKKEKKSGFIMPRIFKT